MTEELQEKEFTAATIEQAIDKACDYFNVTPNHLYYEVTKSSTRGILRSKKVMTIIARPLAEDEENNSDLEAAEISVDFAEKVMQKTTEIIKQIGLNMRVERAQAKNRFIINLAGPDRMYLLNRRAEALESLQYILNKMFANEADYTKILVDSNGYRDQKEHQLIQLAHSTAMKVKKQKRPMTLEPLNSYERRIIHMALSDDDEVRTSSKGEGQLKRVTISLS
ncbi:MAG: Jag N-terminal domain-containing protein [Acidobacteria bacterium]|nr:Jag N-terminal domain-containing protein [Acidobacteriota bacterium]